MPSGFQAFGSAEGYVGSGIRAPTVASIEPSYGPTGGGVPVTITGTFFTGASGATIGGVACTSFAVVNDTTITAVAPAAAAGAQDVVVTHGAGTGTLAAGFYAIANMVFWVRADMGVTGTTTVTAWADESGALHGLTAGSGKEGALNASNAALGNKPSITFATGKYMATGAFAQSATNTIFFVGNRNNTNGTTRFDGLAGDTFELYRPAGNQLRWFRGAVGCTMAAADDTNGHITVAEDNGATSKLYYDSLTAGVTGDAGAGAASGVTMAAHATGVAGYLGDVAEMMIVTGVISSGIRTAITSKLAARYGITLV